MPIQDQGEAITLPDLDRDPLLGFSADGVHLERLIHASTAARVYAARSDDGQALEVWIAADHLARDAAFLARLQAEAQLLATLRHVHVEACLGQRQWTAPGGRVLVALLSEATQGVTLGDLMRNDRLPVRDVLRLFQQACTGLAAAHRMGIVHGDLTPDAIRVTAGGTAKLRAFALGVGGYSAERAEHGLIGSPDYMAPEVGRGQQPSSLSDLYSFGAALMTVVTGDLPFAATTALEAIHRNGTAPVPEVATTHPEFAELAPLITRLLAKDPAQRWMGTDDLARDLLVLSGQVAADLRCRAWNHHRPESLATRVQTALLQRPGHQSAAGASATAAPARESSSGGTTSISRKSVEYFRNPELFKPTGMTPAGGLPVLPAAPAQPMTTRTIRRLEATAPHTGALTTIPSAAAATPGAGVMTSRGTSDRAPAKESSYLSSLAAAPGPSSASSPAPSPTSSATAPAGRGRTGWVVAGAAVLVVGIAAVALWPRKASTPPVIQAPRPAPEIERPATDALASQIASIRALVPRDPAAALSQAALVRRDHPGADLAQLPRALRLEIVGPVASAVQVTREGEPIAITADGILCRPDGEAFTLTVSAPGYLPQEVQIPASSTDSLTHTVTLLDQPRWSLPPIAPTWVRLLSAGKDVLLACDRKVALVSLNDGSEIARLDQSRAPSLLPEQPTWASVLGLEAGRLRLGLSGGLCVETEVERFGSVREIHRGQASVFGLREAPLVLRLGETGMFSLERDSGTMSLVADSRERRLWSRPVSGGLTPWFTVQGDHLVVVDQQALVHLSQEGEALATVALPAARTGEPSILADQSLLIPTSDGVVQVAGRSASGRLPGLRGVVVAHGTEGGVVAAAVGREVAVWRVGAEGARLVWQQQIVPAERQVQFLRLLDDQMIVVDDRGVIRWLAPGDGRVMRTVRPGARSLTPPLVRGQQVVVMLEPGVLAAY